MLDYISFSYYPANVKITKPLGTITLGDFIRANKNPADKVKKLFGEIRQAEIAGDKKLKSELKQGLYYFNPCILTDGKGRSYSNIIGFTGLMVMEFDGIQYAKEFRDWVFDSLKSCVCAYISPSGYGVKFIVKIPVVKTVDEFKSYFYGLGFYFEKYMGFDGTAQNCILPLYLSWDEDLLYRENPKTWRIRGEKIDEFPEYEGDIIPVEDVKEEDRSIIKYRLKTSLEKIEDTGHYIVRSTSLVAGGYVAGGYFEQEEMEEYMFELIEGVDYLQKDLQGYKKTCRQMIKRGMLAPLYLGDE